jgi:hypothetical protein
VRAPAAAVSVLELGKTAHWLAFCFFILGKVFVLVLRQAAIRCLVAASALIPMAQINPSSSRPIAVTIFFDPCLRPPV